MKKILSILITLVISFIIYYFTLPVINIHAFETYSFLCGVLAIYLITHAILNMKKATIELITGKGKINLFEKNMKFYGFGFGSIILVFVLIMVVNFFASPLFNAKSYQSRITIDESGVFTEDIKEVDFNALPLLDRQSSSVLGDRVMGQMSEWVSQFTVADDYTQINYNDTIIRVTPLAYADTIKWFTNRDEGIKGYITVNSVTGESDLVKLDKGMKYVPSALFNENMMRKLRFKYPTTIFGEASFEIDEEGNPYYIVTTIDYTAVELKARVTGVIIFDPITGESTKYAKEDIPTWVDIAYSPELVIEQVDDWGTYKNGFWNSIFGQKNVVVTTDGYNYLAMNDDIYLYTGITSVMSDESNLGFILTNMRTGVTNYYSVPGAEEYSAMASAEGQVQDMGYTSTFPLLINLKGRPTYLVSLKDSNGLVKMYGFVDVADYQKVVVTDSSKGIIAAKDNYLSNVKQEIDETKLIVEELKVNNITSASINGYTYYYITSSSNKFKVSITLSDELPFVKIGDTLKVGYYESENDVIEIEKVY